MNHPSRGVVIASLLAVVLGCRSTPPKGEDPSRPLGPVDRIAVFEDARTLGDGTLPAYLGHEDPEVRARCALALGRIGDPAAVPVLLRALDDPDADVRAEAIFAAGQIGDGSASSGLEAVLAGDPLPVHRALAAEAIGKIGGPEAWGVLAAAAGSETEGAVLGQIALAFWRAGIPESSALRDDGRRALLALADASDPEVRWRAVYAIARSKWEDPECLRALRGVAGEPSRHPQGWDRVFAVRALGDLGDASDLPLLLDALRGAAPRRAGAPVPDWPLRVEILGALAKLTEEDPVTAAEVALVVSADDNAMVRVAAIRLLGQLGRPGLGGLATGEWAESVELGQIVRELANVSLDEAERASIEDNIAGEPSWLARIEAAAALGEVPPPVALPILERLFEDEDRRVRTAVIEALGRFGDEERARALVRRALRVDDLALRGSAVATIARWNDPSWRGDLERAYHRSDRFDLTEVRAEAVGALAALGEAVPVSFFREALDDPEPMVRARAASVIEERTGEAIPRERIHRTEPLDAARLAPVEAVEPPRVRFVTYRGEFVVELFHRDAPVHCRELLDRVEEGFYDGLIFHRVVPNFVVQGGDPRGDGWGGGDRFVRDQIHRRRFERGTVGMPTAGPDTGGVQIFITHSPTPHLDGRYTAFGRVVEGMETVDRIERGDRIVRAVRESPHSAPAPTSSR
jgi:cyclophilin family peptidyl-prolyl cis-trans isomerase